MRCWTERCDRSRDTTTATRIRSVVGCAARVEEQLQLCCGPPVVVRGTGVVLIVASAGVRRSVVGDAPGRLFHTMTGMGRQGRVLLKLWPLSPWRGVPWAPHSVSTIMMILGRLAMIDQAEDSLLKDIIESKRRLTQCEFHILYFDRSRSKRMSEISQEM